MKKTFALLLIMTLFLLGCNNNSKDKDKGNTDLNVMINKVYENASVDEKTKEFLKSTNTSELDIKDKEMIKEYFGKEYDFKKVIKSESDIVPPAYLLSIIEVENNDEANKLASEIKKSFDASRWVCVTAESVETSVQGNKILFVAGDSSLVNELVKSFDSIK